MDSLRPWMSLGLLQGRVHPQWKTTIPMLLQEQGTTSTATTITLLLRTALETWYEAVWLPRCQRTIDQERRLGLYQGTKLRRMREENRSSMNAHPSPTSNLPSSQLSCQERRTAYAQFNSELMDDIDGH